MSPIARATDPFSFHGSIPHPETDPAETYYAAVALASRRTTEVPIIVITQEKSIARCGLLLRSIIALTVPPEPLSGLASRPDRVSDQLGSILL